MTGVVGTGGGAAATGVMAIGAPGAAGATTGPTTVAGNAVTTGVAGTSAIRAVTCTGGAMGISAIRACAATDAAPGSDAASGDPLLTTRRLVRVDDVDTTADNAAGESGVTPLDMRLAAVGDSAAGFSVRILSTAFSAMVFSALSS